MKSVLIKPQNEILKQYIQYFLFFKKEDATLLNYTTFPNTNLCLAIYKENEVTYTNDSSDNKCVLNQGNKNFTSRLYGFHKKAFQVDVHSNIDQVCIIFNPSALRAFSLESYDDLLASDEVFRIFGGSDETSILEQLFDETDFVKRAVLLENIMLKKLKYQVPTKLREALFHVSNSAIETLNVDVLARKLEVSSPTIFRLFKTHLGQNPKTYLKTVRFRKAFHEVLQNETSLTDVAYFNKFFDQAHFIKDFKSFSGYSPKHLYERVSVQQNDFAWIYNQK